MNNIQNKLSVVILTHNDESRIVDTLECVNFADEIIVVDDESTDRTVELVEGFTKNMYIKKLNGNFSNQRNFALNHVHNQWVLFIDSDELISDNLKKEIVDAIQKGSYDGYYIKRQDYLWGKQIQYGEAGSTTLLRLAKKDCGKWHGKVHETWRVKGSIGQLSGPLIHVPHQSVREFIEEVDQYSTLRAEELNEEGKKSSFVSILVYPLAKFVLNYFLRKGYKDGIAGLLYAGIMSFHSFLVRGKLYLLR